MLCDEKYKSSSEESEVAEAVPAHCRGLELDDL